jgi:hypothetical protein
MDTTSEVCLYAPGNFLQNIHVTPVSRAEANVVEANGVHENNGLPIDIGTIRFKDLDD